MKTFNSQAIVLARTDYGEADRILTFLTPDHGKVKAIAKGVRKQKSKLAGGIELFTISELSFIVGRSEINTLISSRLVKNYGNIVKDLNRSGPAYDMIKIIAKGTEEQPEPGYFDLLKAGFRALDDVAIAPQLTEVWFKAQMLKLAGHRPNLTTQKSGEKLVVGKKYDFDFDSMSFTPGKVYTTDQIKFLRLLFSGNQPDKLQKVEGADGLAGKLKLLVGSALQNYVRS